MAGERTTTAAGISVMRPVPGTMSVADLGRFSPEDLDYRQPTLDEVRELARYLTLGLTNLVDGWEDRPPGPLRLPKGRIRAARTCPAQVLSELSADAMNFQLAIGTVCDTAAGILAVHPRFSAGGGWHRSIQTALDQENPEVGTFFDQLDAVGREDFVHKVDELCLPLPDLLGDLTSLRPVTHQRVAMTLGQPGVDDLDVTLTGEVDIVAGTDVRVLVEVKSGAISSRVIDELTHYGLIVALQNERRMRPGDNDADTPGAALPPVIGCALTLGDLAVTPVPYTIEALEGAANRVLEAVDVLIDVDRAAASSLTVPTRPGPYCRWCPRLSRCDNGQAHVEAEDD